MTRMLASSVVLDAMIDEESAICDESAVSLPMLKC